MDWEDEAIVLGVRPHGEGAGVAQLLTHERGRHAGLVHAIHASSRRGLLEPGTRVAARWRARLSDHLGHFDLEAAPGQPRLFFSDRLRLLALRSAAALCLAALPEREPHPAIHDGFVTWLKLLETDMWAAAYVQWEVGLLADLGFGLDLRACAISGATEGLAFVSPRTGRAASAEAAAPFMDKLLPLPGFLIGQGEDSPDAILEGLRLTGHFLENHALAAAYKPMPEARAAFAEAFRIAAVSATSEPS